jgi:hypothetical protein
VDVLAFGDEFVDLINRNCRKRKNQIQFQITDTSRVVEVQIVIGSGTHVLVLPFSTRKCDQGTGNRAERREGVLPQWLGCARHWHDVSEMTAGPDSGQTRCPTRPSSQPLPPPPVSYAVNSENALLIHTTIGVTSDLCYPCCSRSRPCPSRASQSPPWPPLLFLRGLWSA